MYLLDTNVVSELRKAKKADRGVRTWAQALPAAGLYLCAISILELEIGILLIERRDRKQARFFEPGWTAMFCPRSKVASLRLILLLPSGAPRSTCPVLAPIVTLSSRPLPLFTA